MRVAADRAERGVGHGDLAGVAEQQVERQREDHVDQHLVEVVEPDLHQVRLAHDRGSRTASETFVGLRATAS